METEVTITANKFRKGNRVVLLSSEEKGTIVSEPFTMDSDLGNVEVYAVRMDKQAWLFKSPDGKVSTGAIGVVICHASNMRHL